MYFRNQPVVACVQLFYDGTLLSLSRNPVLFYRDQQKSQMELGYLSVEGFCSIKRYRDSRKSRWRVLVLYHHSFWTWFRIQVFSIQWTILNYSLRTLCEHLSFPGSPFPTREELFIPNLETIWKLWVPFFSFPQIVSKSCLKFISGKHSRLHSPRSKPRSSPACWNWSDASLGTRQG